MQFFAILTFTKSSWGLKSSFSRGKKKKKSLIRFLRKAWSHFEGFRFGTLGTSWTPVQLGISSYKKSTSWTCSILSHKPLLMKILENRSVVILGIKVFLLLANRSPPWPLTKLSPISTPRRPRIKKKTTGTTFLLEAPDFVSLVNVSSQRRERAWAGHSCCECCCGLCTDTKGHQSPWAASLICMDGKPFLKILEQKHLLEPL